MNAKYIDTVDVAKLIRKSLKVEFPETKFSVKTSRYAGGSSINVNWTDGPTYTQVNPVVKFYAGSRFDGMTDSTEYLFHTTEAGEEIHYMVDHVFTNRSLSVDFLTQGVAHVVSIVETSEEPRYTIEGNEKSARLIVHNELETRVGRDYFVHYAYGYVLGLTVEDLAQEQVEAIGGTT